MYGITMHVEQDSLGVTLRAFSKEDLPELLKYWNSMRVHMYTMGLFAQTLENEIEWYEKTRQDRDSCSWAIVPDGSETAVGVTSLHHLDLFGSSSSGIIIWDPKWWNKGIASRTHLARTLFAADYLNRLTIKSSVRTENPASLRALQRVGYHLTGIEPRTAMRAGRFLDTHLLCWIHPEKTGLLFPEGVPEAYTEALKRGSNALALARQVVSFP